MPPNSAEAPCRPTLTSLPLDLVLNIADRLSASSVTCLALTCTSLYYSQPLRNIWNKGLSALVPNAGWPRAGYPYRSGMENRNPEYLELVKMLRKDVPTHLLCDGCQKFHPKPQPKVSRPEMEWISCPAAPDKGSGISWPSFGVQLQFPDLQMVMNRHRWGGLHGAPLSSIAINTDWKVIRDTASGPSSLCKFDLEPGILGDNLVVHAMQRLFFTQRQTYGLNAHVDLVRKLSDTFKVCKHRDCFATTFFWTIDPPPEDRNTPSLASVWNRKRTELKWCSSCNTCFFLQAVYHGNWSPSGGPNSEGMDMPADGLELILHSWMLLGGCEYTFSPCWLNISEQLGVVGDPIYSDFIMLQAKALASETFNRIRMPNVQAQYSQAYWSLVGIYHPSLLPAIDHAVALENDPSATEHHEFKKMLRAVGLKIDMSVFSDPPEALETALEIPSQHKRTSAKAARVERLWSSILAKLTCGWFKTSHAE
jgi:hypothetical protein